MTAVLPAVDLIIESPPRSEGQRMALELARVLKRTGQRLRLARAAVCGVWLADAPRRDQRSAQRAPGLFGVPR